MDQKLENETKTVPLGVNRDYHMIERSPNQNNLVILENRIMLGLYEDFWYGSIRFLRNVGGCIHLVSNLAAHKLTKYSPTTWSPYLDGQVDVVG